MKIDILLCMTLQSYSAEVSRYCVVTTCNGVKLAQVEGFRSSTVLQLELQVL